MATTFRRSSYYSRLPVPSDLRGILSRREFLRSLQTANYRDACLKARVWEGQLSGLFVYLREHHQRMKPEQIKALVERYISSTLEACEEDRVSRNVSDDEREAIGLALTSEMEQAEGELIAHDFGRIAAIADDLLHAHNITLSKASPEYRRLCRELLKGQQTILRAEMDRWDGNYWQPHSAAYSALPTHRPTTEAVSLTPSLLFSQAVREYFAHYAHRDARTNREKEVGFSRFIEIVGGDRPLNDMTKADCVCFRETLSRFPRRIPNKFRGRAIVDMLAAIEKQRTPCVRVSKATVNLALDDIRHFFSWAIKHDYYTGKNPLDGIGFEGVEQQSYEVFTDDDLSRIFGSQMFIKERDGKHPERYWIPLVLLFTGARREEIAGLSVADVKVAEGVYFFDITPTETRRLKTKASKRRVPLHSHLIQIGFLSYVHQMKSEGSPALFPKRRHAGMARKTGRLTTGDAIAKWWGRLMKALDIEGKKVLHSFRHVVVTRLMAAGVPQDMREVLVGHESQTVHGKTYGHREFIPLVILKEHLEKLDFRKCLSGLPKYGRV